MARFARLDEETKIDELLSEVNDTDKHKINCSMVTWYDLITYIHLITFDTQ